MIPRAPLAGVDRERIQAETARREAARAKAMRTLGEVRSVLAQVDAAVQTAREEFGRAAAMHAAGEVEVDEVEAAEAALARAELMHRRLTAARQHLADRAPAMR